MKKRQTRAKHFGHLQATVAWVALIAAALLAGSVTARAGGKTEAPLPPFLAGDLRGELRGRGQWALRVFRGDVFVVEGGPAITRRAGPPTPLAPPEILLVIDAGTSRTNPRVLSTNRGTRVALYVDRTSLGDVALAGALLVTTPLATREAAEATTPGVRLHAGARVTVGAIAHGARAVTFAGGVVSASGFVRADHVGRVYTRDEVFLPGKIDSSLAPRSTFLDAPGGRELARLVDYAIKSERLGEPKAGHVLVRVIERDAAVVGWVAEQNLGAPEKGSFPVYEAGLMSSPDLSDDPPFQSLPEGTRLYDARAGHVVGVVTSSWRFHVRGEDRDWVEVEVGTDLGMAPFWARKP